MSVLLYSLLHNLSENTHKEWKIKFSIPLEQKPKWDFIFSY